MYLTASKIKLVACLALLGIGTLSFILIPIMLGQAVTRIEEGANDDDLYQMAMFMLVLAGVAFATIFTAYQLLSSITQGALLQIEEGTVPTHSGAIIELLRPSAHRRADEQRHQ